MVTLRRTGADPTRRQLAELAQRVGVSIQPQIDVEDIEAALELAARGLGDTIVSRGILLAMGRRVSKRLGWVPWIELLIGTYFAMTVYYALQNENYLTVPFLLLFVVGYWYTGLMSLLQGRFSGLALSGAGNHSKPFPVGV